MINPLSPYLSISQFKPVVLWFCFLYPSYPSLMYLTLSLPSSVLLLSSPHFTSLSSIFPIQIHLVPLLSSPDSSTCQADSLTSTRAISHFQHVLPSATLFPSYASISNLLTSSSPHSISLLSSWDQLPISAHLLSPYYAPLLSTSTLLPISTSKLDDQFPSSSNRLISFNVRHASSSALLDVASSSLLALSSPSQSTPLYPSMS